MIKKDFYKWLMLFKVVGNILTAFLILKIFMPLDFTLMQYIAVCVIALNIKIIFESIGNLIKH